MQQMNKRSLCLNKDETNKHQKTLTVRERLADIKKRENKNVLEINKEFNFNHKNNTKSKNTIMDLRIYNIFLIGKVERNKKRKINYRMKTTKKRKIKKDKKYKK